MNQTDIDPEFLRRRVQTIIAAAKEAIRREVETLRREGLPVYVASNGRVIDVSKQPEADAAQ